MWKLIKWLSIPVILFGAILTLYSLVKIGRAAQPPATHPSIQIDIPGVTVTQTPVTDTRMDMPTAATWLAASGIILVGGIVTFAFATWKFRR